MVTHAKGLFGKQKRKAKKTIPPNKNTQHFNIRINILKQCQDKFKNSWEIKNGLAFMKYFNILKHFKFVQHF